MKKLTFWTAPGLLDPADASDETYTVDTTTTIDYENGIFDRIEREFRGFEKVTTTVHDKDKGTDHITETTFAAGVIVKNDAGTAYRKDAYNINYIYDQYVKDQVTEVVTKIKLPTETEATVLSKVKYVYETKNVFTNAVPLTNYVNDATDKQLQVKFPYIKNTYAWMYDYDGVFIGSDGTNGDLVSSKSYTFDTTGSGLITQAIDTSEGDPHHDLDDTASKTTLLKSSTAWLNVVNETTAVTTPVNADTVLSNIDFTAAANRMGNTKYYYDDKTSNTDATFTIGKLTKEEVWNNNGTYNIISEYNYDTVYGYVSQVSTRSASESKTNYNSMRYSYQFNQNGYSMTATAAYPDNLTEISYFDSYGRLKKSTNRYGDDSEVYYDDYGRAIRVQESIEGVLTDTKLFEYTCDPANKIFKAVSKSLDKPEAAGDEKYFFTQVYCDGLGRVIQTYTEGEIENSATTHTTSHVWIKSGQALYDLMGRVTMSGSASNEVFVIDNGFDASTPEDETDLITPVTQYFYDNYGRADYIRIPSKNSTYIDIKYDYSATDENTYSRFVDNADNSYTNEGSRILIKTKVEARDNADVLLRESSVYQDLFGACVKTVTLTENNGTPVYNTTEFDYNLLGRSKVKQNNGNVGVKEFDSLGRIKYLKSPDAGTKIYTYKDNGLLDNVLDHGKITTDNEKTQVYFNYDDFYRIDDIRYNNLTTNDNYIKYQYYDAVDGNEGGETKYARSSIRQISKGNASSPYYSVLYKYDQFSINEIKTIDNVPYNAGYLYDIQGRIKTYTMPESTSPEVLTYTYNNGGMLSGITSNMDSVSYIENINYDKNGQRVYMKYGNDSEMTYAHDPVTMLLDRYVVKDGAGTDILDYNYNFDITGNITNITDEIQVNSQNKSVQTYGYDKIGRLINGTGDYKGSLTNLVDADRNPSYYNITYAYNSDNRMTSQTYKNSSGATIKSMAFEYLPGSHALDNIMLTGSPDNITKIGFTYDDFGNMQLKKKYSGTGGTTLEETMNFDYDLNNNLIHIDLPENDESLDFSYDIKGQRIKKIYKDSSGSTIYSNTYVNGFYTVNNEGGTTKISKHISDGSKIIATKVDNDSTKIMYYHQNHIGSTAMVTDTTGNKFQSYLYMPYGETWVLEKGTLYNGDPADGEIGSDAEIEHLFTGQVFDKESKLYYYNARYYDATVGMFITPDPMMSGLNHYAYASCNPVMYSDPTGLDDENGGDWDNSEANEIASKAEKEDAEEAANKTYTVKKDDTFNGIAKSFGVSPGALRGVNPDYANRVCPDSNRPDLKGYDYITPGDVINLPGKEESKSDQSQAKTDSPNDDNSISKDGDGGESVYANKYVYVDKNMKINIVEDNGMSFSAYKPPFWAEIPGAKLLGDVAMLFRMDNYNPITNWSYLPGDAQDVRDSLRVDFELTVLSGYTIKGIFSRYTPHGAQVYKGGKLAKEIHTTGRSGPSGLPHTHNFTYHKGPNGMGSISRQEGVATKLVDYVQWLFGGGKIK